MSYMQSRTLLIGPLDDWLVVIPLILSIALIGPSFRRTVPHICKFELNNDDCADVKMWHVGIHIWEIPAWETEPDYDEYYAVWPSLPLTRKPP